MDIDWDVSLSFITNWILPGVNMVVSAALTWASSKVYRDRKKYYEDVSDHLKERSRFNNRVIEFESYEDALKLKAKRLNSWENVLRKISTRMAMKDEFDSVAAMIEREPDES